VVTHYKISDTAPSPGKYFLNNSKRKKRTKYGTNTIETNEDNNDNMAATITLFPADKNFHRGYALERSARNKNPLCSDICLH